jgi:2-aminoethylphosphonate-pyruvate transaminase
MTRPVLLNPGPAGTSAAVQNALLRGDMCHREPEFTQLLQAIRARLPLVLEVAGTHEAVLLTGSGTAAAESAVLASVRDGRAIIVVNNGVYGDRLAAIARGYGIPVHEVRQDWTRPVSPERVAQALREHPDADAVACVHHETTTGLLNPVAEIGALVRDTGTCFVLDAISATAIERPSLADVHADLVCGTANKGLHGLPGMSFLLLSARARERAAAAPQRSLYLNAARHLAAQRRGEVLFTPAVQICYALDEALRELADGGGYPARVAQYERRAALVRAGFTELGLHPLVALEHRAASVTALALPDGVGYRPLHDALRADGYVIYPGQGPLTGRTMRVATMGELSLETLAAFIEALGRALHAVRGRAGAAPR